MLAKTSGVSVSANGSLGDKSSKRSRVVHRRSGLYFGKSGKLSDWSDMMSSFRVSDNCKCEDGYLSSNLDVTTNTSADR